MASEGREEVRLLGKWMGPFCLRVQIALNVKMIGYEVLEEKLESKSEILRMSNPIHEKIPILIHRGRPICESLIILSSIDEAWPTSSGRYILPSNPHDRAIARYWANYIDDEWFPNIVGFLGAQKDEEKQVAFNRILVGLQVLEDVFENCNMDKKVYFFNGNTIGYLDITLGCFLGWIRVMEKMSGKEILDEEKTPLLVGWAKRFCSHDVVKDEIPKIDMLVEHAKFLSAKSQNHPIRSPWM